MSSSSDLERAPSTTKEVGHSSVHTAKDEAHQGVRTIEATHQVYGKYSKWFLFLGLGLAAYIYSLDSQTTYTYLAWAASSFGGHSFISTVQTAQAIIVAVGKPVVAKIADVGSRGIAYSIVLLFYVIGYIVIASAKNVETIGGGMIIYSVGYTGLQLLTQVVIADITTLKWRALVSALMTTPFIINAFVGSIIAAQVVKHVGWRWGYGMFTILVPVALAPLILTLTWAERKVKKLNLAPKKQTIIRSRAIQVFHEMDVIGLLLLGTSVALILLPLTLAPKAKGGWNNPSMIAMIVVGFVVIPIFAIWEVRFSKYPILPRRFVFNRAVAIASLIGFFDFISFYLTFLYLYSFVVVVKPWKPVNMNYFVQTQSVSLTVFAIVTGVLLRFLRRYKLVLIGGLSIRLIGVGLMIHSRGANASDAEVVWAQLLQGIGGGAAAICSQVAAQASVTHADVAMATAIVLLFTEIGGAIGSAIAGTIWAQHMPRKLAQYLPFAPEADRAKLFGSITSVIAFPRGSPIREGVISAYSDVMHTMLVVAVCMSIPPILLALFIPDYYLGDTQNAVTETDLSGNANAERAEDTKA